MAWGSKTSATQLTSVSSTEQFFDTLITLNPQETIHCEVEVDFVVTPTDDMIVAVYATLDASSESWDDAPIMEFVIDNGTDPNKVSFLVSGVYKIRIGVRASGGTDTHTSADLSYRADGVGS